MSQLLSPSAATVPPLAPGPRLSRFWKPENVYPALLLVWGLVMALLAPPMQIPDENGHAFRSFHLSRGRFRPDGIVQGWCSGRAPGLLVEMAYEQSPIQKNPEARETMNNYRRYMDAPLEGLPEQTVSFSVLSYSCPVPYLPQAAGIFLARRLGGSLLTAFYAGRLANLAVCVLALAVALRILPFFKHVLGVVALLPISVQQMATLSADALGMATGFLFTALMLRILVSPGKGPGPLMLLALWTSAFVLPLCKIPYALLTLLYLAARPAQLGSLRKYLFVGLVLIAAGGCGTYITLQASTGATSMGEGFPFPDVSKRGQLAWIQENPAKLIKTMLYTIAAYGWSYWEHMGILGWLNTPVNHLALKSYLLFLFFVALVDRREGWFPTLRVRLAGFSLCVLSLLVVHLMLFLLWTPVGHSIVLGYQGRYFLVFLPIFLLLLYSPVVTVKVSLQALLALGVAAVTAVQLATVFAFLGRYYLGSNFEGRYTSFMLAFGALLFIGTVLRMEARAGKENEQGQDTQRIHPSRSDLEHAPDLPLAG